MSVLVQAQFVSEHLKFPLPKKVEKIHTHTIFSSIVMRFLSK